MPDLPLVQYGDVFVLCNLPLPDSIPGYRIRPDGLYLILPPEDVPLFPKERATLTQHPTGYLSEPVLALPCTLSDILDLVLPIGCMDPETLAAWLIEKGAGGEDVGDWLSALLCDPDRLKAWLSPVPVVSARSRTKGRQARLLALRAFLDDVLARAATAGEPWTLDYLPCKKEHVFEVFRERCQEPRYITLATFRADLKAVGAGFRDGVWPRVAVNPLRALFQPKK
jgi:hypothetical protein